MSERLGAALQRLRSRDRWRRIAALSWAGLGGAGLAGLGWLGLVHAGVRDVPVGAGIVAVAATAALLALRARHAAASDSQLARAVDTAAGLPETALTVVRPFGAAAAGMQAANRVRVEHALGGAPAARLRAWRIPRWPLVAALAVLLLLLWLPGPPPRPDQGPSASASASAGGGGGGRSKRNDGDGQGGGGVAPQSGGSGVGENPQPNEAETPPPPTPDKQPPEDQDEDRRKAPEPPQKPGSGTGPLYQDPERTQVGVEKVSVKPLFDDTAGKRRTVLVPDAPTPPTTERTQRNPTGRPPADIDRTDEAALAERIADAAERETVRRFYAILRRRKKQ